MTAAGTHTYAEFPLLAHFGQIGHTFDCPNQMFDRPNQMMGPFDSARSGYQKTRQTRAKTGKKGTKMKPNRSENRKHES